MLFDTVKGSLTVCTFRKALLSSLTDAKQRTLLHARRTHFFLGDARRLSACALSLRQSARTVAITKP